MPGLWRSVGAVIVGSIVSGVVVFLAEYVVSAMATATGDWAPYDAATAEAAASPPAGPFVLVLLGWLLGALVGSYLGARLDPVRPRVVALGVGLLMLVAAVFNLFALPHPVWMWPGALIVCIGGSWLGGRLASRPTQRAAPQWAEPV